MILTQKYKFKKRELTDSPPDITATEDNWDKAEAELDSQAKQITVLSDRRIPDNLTKLSNLEGFGCWVTGSVSQASKITDVPILGRSFRVENKKVVFDDGTYIHQIITYCIGLGTFERYLDIFENWSNWKLIATTDKTVYELEPVNGWVKTGNNICRVTSLGNGTSLLEFELRNSGGTIGGGLSVVNLPIQCIPPKPYMPIIYAQGRTSGTGYIYKNGSVTSIEGSILDGELLRANVLIIN